MQFYIKKAVVELMSFLVLDKNKRQAFCHKYGIKDKCVILSKIDHYVPKVVLTQIENPSFIAGVLLAIGY